MCWRHTQDSQSAFWFWKLSHYRRAFSSYLSCRKLLKGRIFLKDPIRYKCERNKGTWHNKLNKNGRGHGKLEQRVLAEGNSNRGLEGDTDTRRGGRSPKQKPKEETRWERELDEPLSYEHIYSCSQAGEQLCGTANTHWVFQKIIA